MTNVNRNSNPIRTLFLDVVFMLFGLAGLGLLLINLYGTTQPIRKPGLGVNDHELLRFVPEQVWTYEQSMSAIDRLQADSVRSLVSDANTVVNQSLIHVEWGEVDPGEYRQLVPIWENYFLWAIGKFSGLPQFERYHYADYRRNIRRGIGICGDASTVLSSILDRHQIENRLISFNGGHVIVEYTDESGNRYLADPDFGVEMEGNLEQLVRYPGRFRQAYLDAGYPPDEVDYLFEAYDTRFSIFNDTFHFMTKRYIFEDVSYVMKWVLPIALLLLAGFYLWRRKRID